MCRRGPTPPMLLLPEEIDVAAASKLLRQRLATAAGNPLLKSPVTMDAE